MEQYFELTSKQREQFSSLESLYRQWNSKINVISRKDIGQFRVHHLLHSLAIARYVKDHSVPFRNVLDVGTGGGFPGIPLAIMFPDTHFTLCDSIGKKIKVVEAVIKALKLDNAQACQCRCETLAGGYDWIVSRAVTGFSKFMPMVNGLYSEGIMYLKGGDVLSEISECCRICHLSPALFSVHSIGEWFEDDFFREKYLVINRKSF
mgnify:CR=1 FL=1